MAEVTLMVGDTAVVDARNAMSSDVPSSEYGVSRRHLCRSCRAHAVLSLDRHVVSRRWCRSEIFKVRNAEFGVCDTKVYASSKIK